MLLLVVLAGHGAPLRPPRRRAGRDGDGGARDADGRARAGACRRGRPCGGREPPQPLPRRDRRLDRPRRRALAARSRPPAAWPESTPPSSGSMRRRGRRSWPQLGLSAEEAERQAISGPPDGRPVRSVEMTYRYTEESRRAGEALVRAGLAVPLADDLRAARLPRRLHAGAGASVRRRGHAPARGDRRPGRADDRERAPLPRGAPARRPRRAQRAAQPPLLPRDARARRRAGPPLRPPAGADRLRHRRLQGRERPHRAPRRRRRARRGGRADAATRSAAPTSPAASAATSSR